MAPKAPKAKIGKPKAKPAEAKKEEAKKEETSKAEEPKPAEDAEMKDAGAAEPKAEEAVVEETPKEPETPAEPEEDASEISGAKLEAGAVTFYTEDTTLNVMPTANGKLLMALAEGGLQYLLAGAKASVGLKDGRYLFETMITELKNPVEPAASKEGPKPRQLVRVGLALGPAPLLLADSNQSLYFDSEGYFVYGKEKKKVSEKFSSGQAVALVVNLNKSSPNAHTLSLFVDGVRACPPQPLPEVLKGKVLYPAVTFRNVTLKVSFGPSLLRPLPFKCHPLASAAKADCQVKAKPLVKKQEVLFPVSLPEQGGFDWLDQFLQKNRSYVELSDRAIVAWAAKSGIPRVKGQVMTCQDKPEMNYGLPLLDDYSVHKAVWAIAPILPRNYVVMEVQRNLLPDERKKALDYFPSEDFKRCARVVMGEPSEDIKSATRSQLLKKKEAKVLEERKKKKLQKEKEAERKRILDEKKKKALEAKRAREAREKGEDSIAKEEEEAKESEANGAGKEEAEEPEPEEEDELKVELTPEEEAKWFLPKAVPDLTPRLLTQFSKFCIPAAEEGFDDVSYEWSPQNDAVVHLKTWMKDKKLTQKVEDLKPGEWFKENWAKWQKQLSEWKKKQSTFKDPAKKKAAAEAAKKKAAEAKKKAEDGEDGDGETAEEAVEEALEIDPDDVDVFAVEDLDNIGNGDPLYLKFVYQDWALLSVRFELHLLVHAFRRDLDDPERESFHESHLSFYYNLYFKKPFSTKSFGCANVAELVDLVKDTMILNEKNSTLASELPDDIPMDNFVKLTEEHRRDRQRRVDAGDESAELKFTKPAPAAAPRPQPPAQAPPAGMRQMGARPATGATGSRPTGVARVSASGLTPPRGYGAGPISVVRAGPQPAGGIKRPYGAVGGAAAYPAGVRARITPAYGGPSSPAYGPSAYAAPRPMGAAYPSVYARPTGAYAARPYGAYGGGAYGGMYR